MKSKRFFYRFFLLFVLFILLLTFNTSFAQLGFEKSYGGSGSEGGIGVVNTSDGGYVISGYTSTFTGDYDMYLMKLNVLGSMEWSKVYRSYGYDDKLQEVKEIPTGGYYSVGYIEGGFGATDHAILKVDATGNVVWAKNFGGYQSDVLRGVSLTNDGGIIVSGFNASFGAGAKDVQAIKFSGNGNVEWAKTYGSFYEEFNATIIVLSDGNYLIAGDTDISGLYDIRPLLIKTDPSGNIIWAKVYPGYVEDWARFTVETSDGGFIISGDTKSYGLGGTQDIYLIKTDSIGNVEWAKAYGGIGNESGYCILQNYDGKYVVGGFTNSFGFGANDAFLMEVSMDGTLDWFYTYGGQQNDYAFWLKETTDSGYVISGRRASNSLGGDDIYVIKTDKNGNSSCEFTTPNVNVFEILNFQASNYTLFTSNVINVNDLPLTVMTVNSATKVFCETVPVELTSFWGDCLSSGIILQWITATEVNNSGFQIERKTENTEFTYIGFVPGFGTTTQTKSYSFIDDDIQSGTYAYRLKQVDFDGSFNYSNEVSVSVSQPNSFTLGQNFPNPFNPLTRIGFTISKRAHVELYVYNSLGEIIAVLEDGFKEAGYYQTEFDGRKLPSGIYFYTLSAANFISTKKMILLK